MIIPQEKMEAEKILNQIEDNMNDIFSGSFLSSKKVIKFIESFDKMRISFGIPRTIFQGVQNEKTDDSSGRIQEINS